MLCSYETIIKVPHKEYMSLTSLQFGILLPGLKTRFCFMNYCVFEAGMACVCSPAKAQLHIFIKFVRLNFCSQLKSTQSCNAFVRMNESRRKKLLLRC